MRKIDKSQQLSTAYQIWENGLEVSNSQHPSYNSSKVKAEYYKDIVMDALHCQKGLCAYTEVQLCDPQYLTPENWEEGRYKGKVEGRVHNGQLEHFDERLKWKNKDEEKKKKAKKAIDSNNNKKEIYQHKDWLWSNFFVIESDTNNLKSTKTVDYILKPDLDGYDPFKLMEYSKESHTYAANLDLPEADRKRINDMIDILGLNFENVRIKRQRVVERIIKYPFEENEEHQFPTAVAFYKRS
jgi:hypothetical protein